MNALEYRWGDNKLLQNSLNYLLSSLSQVSPLRILSSRSRGLRTASTLPLRYHLRDHQFSRPSRPPPRFLPLPLPPPPLHSLHSFHRLRCRSRCHFVRHHHSTQEIKNWWLKWYAFTSTKRYRWRQSYELSCESAYHLLFHLLLYWGCARICSKWEANFENYVCETQS